MNFICLTVDRLHRGYLGPYGNTWVETPAFDRLASESLLFDQALADSLDLEEVCSSFWSASHALQRRNKPLAGEHPLAALSQQTHLVMLTDDRTLVDLPESDFFAERVYVPLPEEPLPAEEVDETHLARWFASAVDVALKIPRPFGLWLHTGSLGRLWDAPYALRERYAEEDDPEPPRLALPPRLRLQADADPDELLGYRQAYAGQIALFDMLLDAWFDALSEEGAMRATLLSLMSPRGLSLGEHRIVGDFHTGDGSTIVPHGELVQVPWLLRMPDKRGAAARTQAFVQPADFLPTLFDCLGLGGEAFAQTFGKSLVPYLDGDPPGRDRTLVAGPGQSAMRTSAWYLTGGMAGEDANWQLYSKPNDVWEQNEVSQRCEFVVERMVESCRQSEAALLGGTTPPPLDEVLSTGLK